MYLLEVWLMSVMCKCILGHLYNRSQNLYIKRIRKPFKSYHFSHRWKHLIGSSTCLFICWYFCLFGFPASSEGFWGQSLKQSSGLKSVTELLHYMDLLESLVFTCVIHLSVIESGNPEKHLQQYLQWHLRQSGPQSTTGLWTAVGNTANEVLYKLNKA